MQLAVRVDTEACPLQCVNTIVFQHTPSALCKYGLLVTTALK
jgi:hypothetical protein